MFKIMVFKGQEWWLTSVFPVLTRQEDLKFKANLGYVVN